MSKIHTLQDVGSTVLSGLAQPLAEAAIGRLTGMILGESKSVPSRNSLLSETKSARQPMPQGNYGLGLGYFGPGRAGGKTANRPPARKRRRRRRRRGGQGGSGPGGPRQQLNSIAPVAIGSSFGGAENMFKTRGVRSNKHGPGTSVAFASFLATVGSNGVLANGDYLLPFSQANLTNELEAASGFISLNGLNCSGFLLHPGLFGPRMYKEATNWTTYVWKWIRVFYVPTCGTNTVGSITLGASRDPAAFFEAGNTQASPRPDFKQLTQQIPFICGPLYSGSALILRNRENLPLPLEITQGYENGENLATFAYNRSTCFGRVGSLFNAIPATGATYGQVWIEGVIEMYEPSNCFISIGNEINTNTMKDQKALFCCGYNKFFPDSFAF